MTSTAYDYEDKIAKLLTKAEAKGTTPAEAEALTAAAERLMIKYGIDQAMIDARKIANGDKAEDIVSVHIDFSGSYKPGLIRMAAYIADGLGNVKIIQSNYGKFVRIMIVGFESDAAQARTLIMSLHIQAITAMNAWWKTYDRARYLTAMEGFKTRRQFLISFGKGAGERIHNARRDLVSEASTGTDVVLVDRKSRVDKWAEDTYSLRTVNSRLAGGGRDAAAAGRRAGLTANTGGTSVGNRRTAIK